MVSLLLLPNFTGKVKVKGSVHLMYFWAVSYCATEVKEREGWGMKVDVVDSICAVLRTIVPRRPKNNNERSRRVVLNEEYTKEPGDHDGVKCERPR